MFDGIPLFLLQTLSGLLTLAFLLRFFFQLSKISFYDPAAQLIITLTDFAVKPVRRLVPSLRRLDLSTLLLAYLTQLALILCTLWIKDFPLLVAGSHIWSVVLLIALIGVISTGITIFLYAVLIQAVLSWINPYTPLAPTLNKLTSPVLSVLRKVIPTANNIDLSPLVFIIAAQLLLTTILIPLENHLLAML